MNIASIRPSTVDGIKQLAKKLKREHAIPHTEALDRASRQAGFENFVHARRKLDAGTAPPSFPLFLTAHWRIPREKEADPSGRRAGRELLQVTLARPLPDIVSRHQVHLSQGLGRFRMEYADHLEHLTDVSSSDDARGRLVAAVRTLRFMEATGLRPVTKEPQRALLRRMHELPGRDHGSAWVDPVSGGLIYLDEPYDSAVGDHRAERQAWAAQRGLDMRTPSWGGLYYPEYCPPYLFSADVALLDRVTAALARVVPVPIPDPWPNESARNGEDFVSPKRIADGKARKPRPGASYRIHKGAAPYGGGPGMRSHWRPAKPMALPDHEKLGALLSRVSGAPLSWRLSNKVSQQRLALESWVMLEHRAAVGDAAVESIYYGGPDRGYTTDRAECLEAMIQARTLVERGYEDCKPRREMLATLDAAVLELQRTEGA